MSNNSTSNKNNKAVNSKPKEKSAKFKKTIIIISALVLFMIVYSVTVNSYVKAAATTKIIHDINVTDLSVDDAEIKTERQKLKDLDAECILVLGAYVYSNETPSPILSDRLNQAISLYKMGVAPKIIMSGDHGSESYDEVNAMKAYAVAKGVPSEDIFMDHAGFSTYDSIYRVKEIFEVNSLIIVTQEYHLYRAVYLADKLGLRALGVSSNLQEYAGQAKYDMREFLARNKDFILSVFKPEPKYLGDTISVNGSGDITNDRK